MKGQLISALWVGGELPEWAVLSIQSFINLGHRFQLFVYEPCPGVPDGASIRDAREILPEEAKYQDIRGSWAPFADWFRNEFLVCEGGWWTDLDVICLRDDLPDEFPWYCLQEPGLVAVGALAFPPRHPVMEILRAISEDPATVMPWDGPDELAAKVNMRMTMPDVRERRHHAEWGNAGPYGLTRILKHWGLMDLAAASDQLYPLHYTVWRKYLNGDLGLQCSEVSRAWGIHIWGEMLRREPDAWENLAKESIVGELLARHLPDRTSVETLSEKKRVWILVGICSGRQMEERRRACRETWMKHVPDGVKCVFFQGGSRIGGEVDEKDTVSLWVNDDYEHLPAKVLAFYRYALAHYDFEWLFKCDDDTYVALDRLVGLADQRYDLIGDMSLESRGAPSGGAGYLMSRKLVEAFVEHADKVEPCGCEDLIFGGLAKELGVSISATHRLSSDRLPMISLSNDQVSVHWCPPEYMYFLDEACCGSLAGVLHGRHPYWEDYVLFSRNGRFIRAGSCCSGSYRWEDGQLVLVWDNWDDERLTLVGEHWQHGDFVLSPVFGEKTLTLPGNGGDNGELSAGKMRTKRPQKVPVMTCVLLLTPGESIEGRTEMERLGYRCIAYPGVGDTSTLRDTRFEEFSDFMYGLPDWKDTRKVRSLRASFAKMLMDPAFEDDDYIIFGESDSTPVLEASAMLVAVEKALDLYPNVEILRPFGELAMSSPLESPQGDDLKFEPLGTGKHTLDVPSVWGTHALIIPQRSRRKVAELFLDCQLPTDTSLEVACANGELDMRVCKYNCFYQKTRTTLANDARPNALPPLRMALCMASYKRPEDLIRQVYAMMNQSYDNFCLFVAVKGIPEYFVRMWILPQFQHWIDMGKLVVRCFPNTSSQLTNLLDTVRGIDVSSFDLFLKIDDDDFYCRDYLHLINEFHQMMPIGYSSYFSDMVWTIDKYDGTIAPQQEWFSVFGPSMVMSRQVANRLMADEQNPETIRKTIARYDGGAGHCRIAWSEDNYLFRLMKVYGCCNIARFIRQKGPENYLIYQKSNTSVMRGGLVSSILRKYDDVSEKPLLEFVMTLFHPYWTDSLVILGNRARRITCGDEAEVLDISENAVTLRWDHWGTERFVKDSRGAYVLENTSATC